MIKAFLKNSRLKRIGILVLCAALLLSTLGMTLPAEAETVPVSTEEQAQQKEPAPTLTTKGMTLKALTYTESPVNNAKNVDVNENVVVTFGEPITAVDLSGITINGSSSGPVTITSKAIVDDKELTITHNGFQYNEDITVFIPAGAVKSDPGGDENDDITFSFETVDPSKHYTSPANGATGVSVSTTISVTFEYEQDPIIDGSNLYGYVTITPQGGAPLSRVTYSLDNTGKILTISYPGSLAYNTQYTVEIQSAVVTATNYSYTRAITFSFTTGSPPVIQPSVNPTEAVYDIGTGKFYYNNNEYDKLAVEFNPGSYSLTGISHYYYTNQSFLTENEHYTVSGNTYTFVKSWIETFPDNSSHRFAFHTTSGQSPAVNLQVVNSKPSAPRVTSISPARNAINIPIATGDINVTFNKKMNAAAGTVTLKSGSKSITLSNGRWNADGTVFTISYSGLQHETAYVIGVTGFKDTDGNEMALFTPSGFATEALPPIPNLVSLTPNGVNVSIKAGIITARFDQPMSPDKGSVTLKLAGAPYTVINLNSKSWSEDATQYTAAYPELEYGTAYILTASGFVSQNDVPMSGGVSVEFTTEEDEKNDAPPKVLSITPGGRSVPVRAGSIKITFNMKMDTSNQINNAVTLSESGSTAKIMLTGSSWNTSGTVLTLDYPALDNSTTYRVSVSGLKSADGVAMASGVSYTFSTVSPSLGSIIADVSPAGNNVPFLQSEIAVEFTEEIGVTGIITLKPIDPVGEEIILGYGRWEGQTYTLSYPALTPDTLYRVSFKEFKGADGVAYTTYSYTFKTAKAPVTGPYVTNISPGGTDVNPEGFVINVWFSEEMDGDAGSVRILDSAGNTVPSSGQAWDAGKKQYTLSFADNSVDFGSEYSIEVSGFKSASGAPMDGITRISIKTMGENDAPYVTSITHTAPQPLTVGMCGVDTKGNPGPYVAVTFNRPMKAGAGGLSSGESMKIGSGASAKAIELLSGGRWDAGKTAHTADVSIQSSSMTVNVGVKDFTGENGVPMAKFTGQYSFSLTAAKGQSIIQNITFSKTNIASLGKVQPVITDFTPNEAGYVAGEVAVISWDIGTGSKTETNGKATSTIDTNSKYDFTGRTITLFYYEGSKLRRTEVVPAVTDGSPSKGYWVTTFTQVHDELTVIAVFPEDADLLRSEARNSTFVDASNDNRRVVITAELPTAGLKVGETSDINISVKDYKGDPVKSGTVSVAFKKLPTDKEFDTASAYTVDVVDGRATFTYTPKEAGTSKEIKFTYNAEAPGTRVSSIEMTTTVLKGTPSIILTQQPAFATVGQEVTIAMNINNIALGTEAKYLTIQFKSAGGKVLHTIGDVPMTYNTATSAVAQVNYTYTQAYPSLSIVASFAGDDNYNAASGTTTTIVNAAPVI